MRPREASTQTGRTHRCTAGDAAGGDAPSAIGSGEPAAEPFDLRRMIAATAQPMVTAAGEKGLVLEVKTSDALPGQVIGHAPSVGQVLSTLLENAVELTERGEVVASVTAQETGSGRVLVHFEVSDTGSGVSAQALDGSGGGGLADARELVEAMDGRLECASAAGVGSTLWFSVPLDLLG